MEKQAALPKNIRQIGDIQGKEKLCMEDYVMTFIRKKEKTEEKGFLGIFLGEIQKTEQEIFLFIRGVLEIYAGEKEESQSLPDKLDREKIMEQIQEHFSGWDVLGCCVIGTYPSEKMKELAGALPECGRMIYHLQEQEESVYWKEQEQYRRVSGFFVFYEQNRKMQDYISFIFPEDSIEKESAPDRAIESFRKKVKEKGESRNHSMLKLASSFFVVTVLAAGAVAVNRMGQLQRVKTETQPESSTLWEVSGADTEVIRLTAENGVNKAGQGLQQEALASSGEQQSREASASSAEQQSREVSAPEENLQSQQILVSDTLQGPDSFWEESEAMETENKSGETEENRQGTEDAKEAAAQARQLQASYTIKEGDTLAGICQKYYGSLEVLDKICSVNGISDANVIVPGQKIFLP